MDGEEAMPTLEAMYEIHDDEGHYKIQVGPDRDGLEMIELRYYNSGEPKPATSMAFTKEEASLIAEAILALTMPKSETT
jgi:hypothetical protein